MSDWRELVAQQARHDGISLPSATCDEIALHLEDLHEAALGAGCDAAEARQRVVAALAEAPLAELRRHAASDPSLRRERAANDLAAAASGRSLQLWSNVRTAVRQFRQHPGFALAAILVLGLGTGAATVVYSLVDSIVVRPLPYAAPDRLVTMWDTNYEKGLGRDPISPVNFMDQRALPVFKDAAAWWRPGINLTDSGLEPVRVKTIEVSGNLFSVLGVSPQLGAGFPAGGPLFVAGERIAVVSDRLWRTRYNADPGLVGRHLILNDTPYQVVGIMPPGFHYPDSVDIWQRLTWDMTLHSRHAHFMEAVLRLGDGKSLEEARAASDALALRLAADFPASNKAWGTRLTPLLEDKLGYYRPALVVLFGAVALLLVIGCLNVASLMLTRALSREKEIAVRIALGAAPRQLVTQLLCEGLVLSLGGALLGLLLAAAALPLAVRLSPVSVPRLEEASLRFGALGIGVAVVVATTLLFGLIPAALLVKRRLASDLKAGERGSSRGARRTYSVLVAGEVALACVLLVSSALLVRTVTRMIETPTGVDADAVVTTTVLIEAQTGAFEEWLKVERTQEAILDAIRSQPGVLAAGAANRLPLDIGWRTPFGIEGVPAPARPEDAPLAQFLSVSDGFFESMGAQLGAGRTFGRFDTDEAAPVVMVNETFAQRFLAGSDPLTRVITSDATGIGPLGRNLLRIRGPRPPGGRPPSPPTRYQVIGVVRDVRNVPLGQAMEPALYFTTRQFPFQEVFVTVRATSTGAATAALRAALRTAAPQVPMAPAVTWGERIAARSAEPRLLMAILVLFGSLAGLLAAIGVYSMFSWSVALRSRELAIRLALGARPALVGGMIVRQSALLVGAGLAAGLLLVRAGHGALERVLFEVSPGDLRATMAASAVLVLVALCACLAPALRAMHVDPAAGLRSE